MIADIVIRPDVLTVLIAALSGAATVGTALVAWIAAIQKTIEKRLSTIEKHLSDQDVKVAVLETTIKKGQI